MATPDQIPSDLTLEIGGSLNPERFLAITRAFFGYVEEVSKSVAPSGAMPDWIVRVREGSSLIGVDPGQKANTSTVKSIYAKIEQGVNFLAIGQYDEARFSDAAIKHLKVLAETGDVNRKRPTPMRLWIERKPIMIGAEIAQAIREDWRSDYSDFGTVEGRLEAIQDRSGLQLRIRDTLLNITVQCYVDEDLLPIAFGSFRKRVEVSGVIHYRRNGSPISIDAENIELLPDDATLPSIDDVRGILSGTA
jgi:hypothetical protein